ncbi:MAG: hypothetical protein PHU50_07015, partial [Kiritimatiellae bacterium]|nr:hypothetical protein [Kiritimatiellia bacterium]
MENPDCSGGEGSVLPGPACIVIAITILFFVGLSHAGPFAGAVASGRRVSLQGCSIRAVSGGGGADSPSPGQKGS